MTRMLAHQRRAGQRGSTIVEFALVSVMFLTLMMAITSFGHWLFTLEMVADATRLGARLAAVCDLNDSTIKARMQERVPQLSLTNSELSLQYVPSGCTKSNCQAVQVSLNGVNYHPWIPFLASAFAIPPFATTLPRESLESVNAAGETNPVCN